MALIGLKRPYVISSKRGKINNDVCCFTTFSRVFLTAKMAKNKTKGHCVSLSDQELSHKEENSNA